MANTELKSFRGFRELLNFGDPEVKGTDPAVKSNRFLEQMTKTNLKAMEAAGVSFDLHFDPHQYQQAADVWDTVPNLITIIDHRGCPKNV